MKIKPLFNNIYIDNVTIEEIIRVLQPEIDTIEYNSERAFKNTFAITADSFGLSMYEELLDIQPDLLKESLEYRRAQVITAMSQTAPYTKLYLQDFLNNVFGVGNWQLIVDNLIYTVFIDISTPVKNLYDSTIRNIRRIIPSNMILFTKRLNIFELALATPASAVYMQLMKTHITTPVKRGESTETTRLFLTTDNKKTFTSNLESFVVKFR